MHIHPDFPRYRKYDPLVPVYNLTPDIPGCLHRFFDTSPISPSGRYAAVLQMPDETRLNTSGETADILLIDLEAGPDATRVIYETAGWEPQMGANINWGADDDTLVFNDVDRDTWQPVGIRLNPHTGEHSRFAKGVYHLSPDGRFAACCSLEKMPRTQVGYGVRVPNESVGLNDAMPEDDGVFIVNVESGAVKTFVSIRDLHTKADHPSVLEEYEDGWHYGFHAKWSPDGSRLLFTTRWVPRTPGIEWNALHNKGKLRAPGMKFNIFTITFDGGDIQNAVPARYWVHGGHHINWSPDSQFLTMNLAYFTGGNGHHFVRASLDGDRVEKIIDSVPGSGHPTLHPDGRHILTDCYQQERWTGDDGSTPLRWIDLETGTEQELLRIITAAPGKESPLRCDPHPAWTRDWTHVTFNAVPDNTRRVMLADMRSMV